MVLLVDGDTAVRWVFTDLPNLPKRPPSITNALARARFQQILLPFICVPDLRRAQAFAADHLTGADRAEFDAVSDRIITSWLTQVFEVIHAERPLSFQWLNLCANRNIAIDSTDAHFWVIAMAQSYVASNQPCRIATEDPTIYRRAIQAGLLPANILDLPVS